MPDFWMDVDAALGEVPVNLMPLIDDTDFKTIEDALAYNAAGMDLRWNFVTTAGAYTSTAVTPTTSGDYDWTHQGDGMYSIEIPASGGASINNDTEGFGWFSGKITGVLPWRGPVIGFRAAALNNALIDSAWSTTRGLAGTALPDAAADAAGGLIVSDAGGLDADAQRADIDDIQTRIPAALIGGRIDANIGAISTDATAADNAEAFFDGTGYAGTNNVIPTVTTLTGHTAQTGDGYAILANVSYGLAALKTLIDAIGAKTTNLPSDPADASDISSAFNTVNSTLATIASYIDTEVAAIKAKTDNLPAAPASTGDIPSAATNAAAVRSELTTELARIDAAITTRASQTSVDTIDGIVDAILVDTDTTIPATLTSMAGATFDTSTDSLEALRNRGDAAWITATGFSTHSAADVWAVGTRTITGGTITTYTGNTPQTGDAYAYVVTNVGALGANLNAADDAVISAIAALNNVSIANVTTGVTTALTTALTEGYRSTNATGSVRDLLYELLANVTEFAISGTTKTAKKLDGSTTAKTYTLDSSTAPTSITEAT